MGLWGAWGVETWTAADWAQVFKEAGVFVTALAALVAALRASRASRRAEIAAREAGEKAAQAAREQLTFALRREVRAIQANRSDPNGATRSDSAGEAEAHG